MPDLLDWQITDASGPDESPSVDNALPSATQPAAHPRHLRHFSRWMWMTLGGLTLIVILGLMVFSWGNQRRVTDDVRNIFLAEEGAARIGNINTLTDLTAAGYADWLDDRLALARQDLAAPVPALLFNPGPYAGDIISITTFSPDIMQTDLLRTFTGPEGEVTHFATTQFYQYQNGWKRTPTPPYFSGDLRQFEGRRLTIIHFERDAELINQLGPYLDNVLKSACAEWECADNFNIALQFLEDTPAFEPYSNTGPEPLTLKLLAYADTAWLDASLLNLPTPHISGTPADEASQAVFQRVLGQQVLLYAAHRFASEENGQKRNALAYALAARLAVRLRLDPPNTLNIPQLAPATSIEALWDLQNVPVWEHPGQRALALRGALTNMNVLLEDQSTEIEQDLFRQFRHHNNPRGWLVAGLGRNYADIQAQLVEAGGSTLSPLLPPQAEPTLALQCLSGPQFYYEFESQVWPFITGSFLDAQISGWPWLFTGNHIWSPDGNALVLNLSGQPALLDLSAASLTWLNISRDDSAFLPRAWVSDTTLVYLTQSELRFLDVAQPNRQFPVFVAVTDYVPSPDGTRAVVVWDQPDGQGNGQIAVMPVTGGPLLNIDFGASPVWAADGSALIYIHREQYRANGAWLTRSSVRRADIVHGLRYIVQEGDSMWSIVGRYDTSFDAIWTINQMQTNVITPGQVLVIPIQESESQVVVTRDLLTSETDGLPLGMNLIYLTGSPDGETLAVVLESQTDNTYLLLLVNADGSLNTKLSLALLDTGLGNPQRLIRTNPNDLPVRLALNETTRFILPPRFSADGQFLAVMTEQEGAPMLNLYSVSRGRLVRLEQGVLSFAWSAHGHRLALTSAEGVFTLEDPALADGQRRMVTHERCEGVWWRP